MVSPVSRLHEFIMAGMGKIDKKFFEQTHPEFGCQLVTVVYFSDTLTNLTKKYQELGGK
jgi:hypothetical protein